MCEHRAAALGERLCHLNDSVAGNTEVEANELILVMKSSNDHLLFDNFVFNTDIFIISKPR